MSAERRACLRFEERVAECRGRADALCAVAAEERPRTARRAARLFEASIEALRCAPASGARPLAALADAMEAALESLRALCGLADPRVRAVLLRTVLLLEGVERARESAEEADALRAALASAVSDVAWREHARGIWIRPIAGAPGKPDPSELPRARGR